MRRRWSSEGFFKLWGPRSDLFLDWKRSVGKKALSWFRWSKPRGRADMWIYAVKSNSGLLRLECVESGRCGRDGLDGAFGELYISVRRSPIILL